MGTVHQALQLQQTHRHRNQATLASICAHLEAMQLGPVHMNAAAPGSSVHVDILLPAVQCDGKPVALTLLGVHETARNTGKPLGNWLLRCRIIESCGLHAVSITDDAWESSTAPDVMLRNLLQEFTYASA
jgi:hypothetical protein